MFPWPNPNGSIFPAQVPGDQVLRLYFMQQQIANFIEQKKMSVLQSMANQAALNLADVANKPKFDFTHMAESIESEQKQQNIQVPDISPKTHSIAAPYEQPWFMLPGRGRAPGRSSRPKKEFICKYCHRNFTKSYNLLIHERTHTDERPYSCDTCGKAFRRQDHLRDHKFIHQKDKPFKCDICNKGFCQSRTLLVHKATHADAASRLALAVPMEHPRVEVKSECSLSTSPLSSPHVSPSPRAASPEDGAQ